MSAPTQPPSPTAGELWYGFELDDRTYEWGEHGLNYVRTVTDKWLEEGRKASAEVERMKHEIREI